MKLRLSLLLVTFFFGCGEVVCGDRELDEECDDGNLIDGDGCDSNCTLTACGNGVVASGKGQSIEECDDGNIIAGDGCSPVCQVECGDGLPSPGEECDDGNSNDNDTCPTNCQLPVCGDGFTFNQAGGTEACDDGNTVSNDGCVADCSAIEECGDGIVQDGIGEECDDSNTIGGDGCSTNCRNESCGDGIIDTDSGEFCDDGNFVSDDGCEPDCSLSGVSQISPGGAHTCALLNSGNVRCWGQGGRLGYANSVTIGDDEKPSAVGNVNVGGSVTQLTSSIFHNCALLSTGNVRCWGLNFIGLLGYGNFNDIGDNETPASAGDVNIGGTVSQISAEFRHTCATLNNGGVRCWGEALNGKLGYGNLNFIGDDEPPASAGDVNVGAPVAHVSVGDSHTCALLTNGNVRCWGSGFGGRLGYGDTNNIGDDEAPASAGDVNVGGEVIQLDAGSSHTCALLTSGNVRCWGSNASGQLGYGDTNDVGDDETPASAGDVNVGGTVVQISAGGNHTCALLSTGKVRCWGSGFSGQLGYGNTNNIGDDETPASAGDVPVGGPIKQIVASRSITCAILVSGFVRCWGQNFTGQLGYGNTTQIGDNETPASLGFISLGGSASQVVNGDKHACALLDTGDVRCWGDNSSGALGYINLGNIGDNETPLSKGPVNTGTFPAHIAAGGRHTCIFSGNSLVRCWGPGELVGYGNSETIGDDEDPASAGDVIVSNVGSQDVTQLVAGFQHTCALLSNGKVRCWGRSDFGMLGYGNTDTIGDDEDPVDAGDVDVGGLVTQIDASPSVHTCAVLITGGVRCWGENFFGQFGYGVLGNIGDDETPASIGDINVGAAASQVAVGERHVCALLTTGDVRCWGNGFGGQLGYGNTEFIGDNETPASAGNVNIGGAVTQIVAGSFHTCALLTTGNVRCWGGTTNPLFNLGQLGYGNTNAIGDDETPASAGDVNVGGSVVRLTAGAFHTCALLEDNNIRCWGDGALGQLGYGNTNNIGDDETPASAGNIVVSLDPSFSSVGDISAGFSHTCALVGSNTFCWGQSADSQLGHPNAQFIGDDDAAGSEGDVNIGASVAQLTASHKHTCAVLDTGNLRCWGQSSRGQLGAINFIDPPSTVNVNVGGPVTQASAGDGYTCALLDTGGVRCWGHGDAGRLGYGIIPGVLDVTDADDTNNIIGDNETPASVGDVNIGGAVQQIAASVFHTCALLETGAVRCWGRPFEGQLGYGNTIIIGDDEAPASAGDVPVGGLVTQLSLGGDHTCALLDAGNVRCWGNGLGGQLGYSNPNTIGDNETPASRGDVPVGGFVVQVAAGNGHTCALLETGTIKCWGSASSGQLGYGNQNTIGDNEAPASIRDVNVGGLVVQLSASAGVTCALLESSDVRCWGDNSVGQLGLTNTINIGDNETPASLGPDVSLFGFEYAPSCGDGFFHPEPNEECEDGNHLNGDGCSSLCLVE